MKRSTTWLLVVVAAALAAAGALVYQAHRLSQAADWYFADISGRMAKLPGTVADLGSALAELGDVQHQVANVKLLPPASPMRPRVVVQLELNGQRHPVELAFALRQGRWQPVDAPAASLRVEAGGDAPRLVLDIAGKSALSQPLSRLGRDRELLTVLPGKLEFMDQGWLEVAPYLASFDAAGHPSRLLLGVADVELYRHRERLAAVVAPEPFDFGHIRVNLSTSEFQSIYHQRVTLTCSGPWTLEVPVSGDSIALPPGRVDVVPHQGGTQVQFGGQEHWFGNRLFFSAGANERIKLASVARQGGYVPAYRGRVEVANFDNQLVVVNRVNLEHYLYAVVPSEMPAGFGADALAVQAVVARTYAVGNMLGSRWQATSAHVVDSVLSQVYHNQPEQAVVNASVDATRGLIVAQEGQPAAVRFFSTSCGYTANAHEVWADGDGAFPGTVIPWLTARPQFPGGELPGSEEDFARFIDNPPVSAYDAGSPWFRWQVTVDARYLAEIIAENILLRHSAEPRSVLEVLPDGSVAAVEQLPAEPVGRLLDLVPVARGGGGLLLEVDVVGSEGTWRVQREYNIRHVLRPLGPAHDPAVLERQGPPLENFSLLPSGFVYWDIVRDGAEVAQITFRGGGFGHGVGMSQYGVRTLTELGWSLEEIIAHYFPGTRLSALYQ